MVLLPVHLWQDGVAVLGLPTRLLRVPASQQPGIYLGRRLNPDPRHVPRLWDSSDGPGLAESAALLRFRWKSLDFPLLKKCWKFQISCVSWNSMEIPSLCLAAD